MSKPDVRVRRMYLRSDDWRCASRHHTIELGLHALPQLASDFIAGDLGDIDQDILRNKLYGSAKTFELRSGVTSTSKEEMKEGPQAEVRRSARPAFCAGRER